MVPYWVYFGPGEDLKLTTELSNFKGITLSVMSKNIYTPFTCATHGTGKTKRKKKNNKNKVEINMRWSLKKAKSLAIDFRITLLWQAVYHT